MATATRRRVMETFDNAKRRVMEDLHLQRWLQVQIRHNSPFPVSTSAITRRRVAVAIVVGPLAAQRQWQPPRGGELWRMLTMRSGELWRIPTCSIGCRWKSSVTRRLLCRNVVVAICCWVVGGPTTMASTTRRRVMEDFDNANWRVMGGFHLQHRLRVKIRHNSPFLVSKSAIMRRRVVVTIVVGPLAAERQWQPPRGGELWRLLTMRNGELWRICTCSGGCRCRSAITRRFLCQHPP